MSERPPLVPGDHLPAISLLEPAGAAFDLMQQGIAGRPRVVVFGSAVGERAIAAAEAACRAAGAVLLPVTTDAASAPASPEQVSPAPASPAPARLHDPEGRIARALGVAGGGTVVITPRGRLGFAQAGGADALRNALATLPETAHPMPVRRGGAPVLLVPDILEPALVAALLAHWEQGEKQRDRVAGAAEAASADRLKRRADVWLDDRALYTAFAHRLNRRVIPEMQRAFRFVPASFEVPRIGCYDAADAGAFGAHRDNRTPFTAHRRFAMSLNLNTGSYAGGTLRFPEFGAEDYEPGVGGAAIFGCDLLHEALPVTAGRRFAIFTFFTDAEGARAEAELVRRQQAAGVGGVVVR